MSESEWISHNVLIIVIYELKTLELYKKSFANEWGGVNNDIH